MTEWTLVELIPQLCLLVAVIINLMGWNKSIAAVFMLVSLLVAFFTDVVDLNALLVMAVLPVFLFVWVNHYFADWARKFGLVIFSFLAVVLAFHLVPGVNNFKVFDRLVFSENSAPFDMYFNFDKVYLGLCLVMLLPELERVQKLRQSLLLVAKYFVVAGMLLMPIVFMFTGIDWEPKLNPYILLWGLNNFFFVCFSEEVIFRYFLQRQLVRIFRYVQYGDILGVGLGAILFGLAHWSGGLLMVSLGSFAGLFYGFCFYHSNNYRSSMLLHFSINLCHVFLFTYPWTA